MMTDIMRIDILSDLGISIGLKLVPLARIGSSLVYKITARGLDLTVNLYIMLLEQKVHNYMLVTVCKVQ